jgi:hypothetical protein
MARPLDETLELIRAYTPLAMGFDLEDVGALAHELEMQHAIMPIKDPTYYRDNMKNLQDNQRIVAAFYKFRRTLEELKEEMLARPQPPPEGWWG